MEGNRAALLLREEGVSVDKPGGAVRNASGCSCCQITLPKSLSLTLLWCLTSPSSPGHPFPKPGVSPVWWAQAQLLLWAWLPSPCEPGWTDYGALDPACLWCHQHAQNPSWSRSSPPGIFSDQTSFPSQSWCFWEKRAQSSEEAMTWKVLLWGWKPQSFSVNSHLPRSVLPSRPINTCTHQEKD